MNCLVEMIKCLELMNHTWDYKKKIFVYLIYFKIFFIKEIIQLIFKYKL